MRSKNTSLQGWNEQLESNQTYYRLLTQNEADNKNSTATVQRPVRATAFKKKLVNEVLSLIKFRRSLNVLDVGCGNGWLSYELATALKGNGRVVGIDVNETAVNQAQQGLSTFKYNNVEFHILNVTEIPYRDQFDYIICVNSFHHLNYKEKALNKIKSALSPFGEVILVEYNGDSTFMKILDASSKDHKGSIHFLKPRELLCALNSAGLKESSVTLKRMYWIFSTMVGHAKKETTI